MMYTNLNPRTMGLNHHPYENLLAAAGKCGFGGICRLPRYLTKPRQRRSEWDMAGSDGISRVSAVFRGKSLLTNKMRII